MDIVILFSLVPYEYCFNCHFIEELCLFSFVFCCALQLSILHGSATCVIILEKNLIILKYLKI